MISSNPGVWCGSQKMKVLINWLTFTSPNRDPSEMDTHRKAADSINMENRQWCFLTANRMALKPLCCTTVMLKTSVTFRSRNLRSASWRTSRTRVSGKASWWGEFPLSSLRMLLWVNWKALRPWHVLRSSMAIKQYKDRLNWLKTDWASDLESLINTFSTISTLMIELLHGILLHYCSKHTATKVNQKSVCQYVTFGAVTQTCFISPLPGLQL